MKKGFLKTAVGILAAASLFLGTAGNVSAQKAKAKTSTATVKTKTPTAKATALATTTLTCKIGMPGPGGGTVFYENPNYAKDGWRYLEAYWSDEMFGLSYAKGASIVSDFNAGKGEVGARNIVKKSDWYVPDETELNSLTSTLGYPNGTLPPGSYFVNGGKKTVSFDFDLKTKKRALNKVPAKFNKDVMLKGKNAKALSSAKFKALDAKRAALNVGNIVAVRKITTKELTRAKARFSFDKSKTAFKPRVTQGRQQQQQAMSQQNWSPTGFEAITSSSGTLPNYSAIDNYVLNLTIPDSMSIEDAARKICQTATNEKQKARAIYAWLGYNITYDHASLSLKAEEQEEIGIRDADKTYARRTGVCAGYAKLFCKMAAAVGLNAEYLGGYSLGASYKYGDSTTDGLHSWNGVRIGNDLMLLDATWGACYSQFGSGVPVLGECWFDCDKELFALTHYPLQTNDKGNIVGDSPSKHVEVPANQGLSKPISEAMFKASPFLNPAMANAGIKGSDVLMFLKSHPKGWTILTYNNFDSLVNEGLRFNKFELSREIVVGETAKFNFTVPNGKTVFIYFKGELVDFLENQKDFELKLEEPGLLEVCYGTVTTNANGGRSWSGNSFLTYNVVSSRTPATARENAITAAFASY
ncbi:MAG: hypothetical protein IKO57_07460 [Treponema sp.]|nr:hypothetical protein [Treponema sp.]